VIVRHTLFNLIGLGAPLLVAIACIPPLIHGLGVERFGLLTLIWAVVSYFGLFDLGLGRSLTQQVSVALAMQDRASLGPLIGTATILLAGLGILAGVVMALLAPWGVDLIQGVSDRAEVIHATYAMAVAMPAIVLTAAFRGLLEARHAFGLINLIRVPMGVYTFVGPLLAMWWLGPQLALIAWVLVIGRIIGCVVHGWFAWRLMRPDLGGNLVFTAEKARLLGSAGGWMTVTNVVSPFMGYVDRFLIGALISPAAVAYYATPQEIVTRLNIIPGALTAVLFPTFAATTNAPQLRRLFLRATSWLALIMLPIPVLMVVLAHPFLAWWIGSDFAAQSAMVFQVLAIGMFINCLAHIPYALLQGTGHAHVVALVHLIELPLFIVLVVGLVSHFGYPGAAYAWFIRITVDAGVLFVVSHGTMRDGRMVATPITGGPL
jgi:O-antigen/teichoic acid export membrane protein